MAAVECFQTITSMVQFHLFALQTQEVKIGVVLVLRHAEYLPSF